MASQLRFGAALGSPYLTVRARRLQGWQALHAPQHILGLPPRDAGEPFEKIIDARAAFEVLEQGSDGNARAPEQPFAAHLAGYALNRGTLAPIQHDGFLT